MNNQDLSKSKMSDYCQDLIRFAYLNGSQSREETDSIKTGYNEFTKAELLGFCKVRKYTPVVAKFLLALDVDSDYWRGQYEYYKQRNKELIKLTNEIFSEFEKNAINKVIVYENFGALLAADTDTTLFGSGDIDLYAARSELKGINMVLKSFGFEEFDNPHFDKTFRVYYHGQLLGEPFRVNLMLTPLVRYKFPIKINYDKIINWGDMTFYKSTQIKLPSKEALLYLCLLRISVMGYSRPPDMRMYIDIYNATVNKPEWSIVLEWAKADNSVIRVASVAIIAHELFNIQVPEKIIQLEDEHPNISKLLNIVCDRQHKRLNLNMSKFDLLKMEIYSNNDNLFKGVLKTIFPGYQWINEYYQRDGDSFVYSYFRYLKHFFG